MLFVCKQGRGIYSAAPRTVEVMPCQMFAAILLLHDLARNCTFIMNDEDASYSPKPLLVLIAGPYLSGTDGDPAKISANRARLESFALPIYQRGHLPMVGEWMALPIIRAAGGRTEGDEVFRAYQYPVAGRLLGCCDAVLRIGGASQGADLDVARARELGLPIYTNVNELPERLSPAGSSL